jgi:8-oxo-dGTP diphosphatase
MKYYVCGFLFSPDKRKVVLIKKNKPEWQKGLLNGVGGHIEEDETPIQAMVREFKEETGLRRPNWTMFCELETEDKTAYVYFFYSFSIYNVKPKSMTDEKVILFPIKNIHKVPCIPNLNWLLFMCLDPQHISGNFICNGSMK